MQPFRRIDRKINIKNVRMSFLGGFKMATIVGKRYRGTAIVDNWLFGDYHDRSEFWTDSGNDTLVIHCDRSYINMDAGNDKLTLTGAWNFVRMGAGNDYVFYSSPKGQPTQIGNIFSLGSENDVASILGDWNTVNGDTGSDQVNVKVNYNKID